MLGINFSIVHYGCPSTISTERYPKVKSRILQSNIIYENEVTVLMHATCEDITELKSFLKFWEEYEKVTRFALAAISENEAVFMVSLRDYTENVTRYIIENKGFFTAPTVITDGEEHWSVVLSDEETKDTFFKQLEEIGRVRIHNITHMDHLGMAIPMEYVELTSKQIKSLKMAYLKGYYDYPKKVTSRDLAESMGVSQSTLLEHIRKAENKIIQKIVHHI